MGKPQRTVLLVFDSTKSREIVIRHRVHAGVCYIDVYFFRHDWFRISERTFNFADFVVVVVDAYGFTFNWLRPKR